jgi:hypothetical protein
VPVVRLALERADRMTALGVGEQFPLHVGLGT